MATDFMCFINKLDEEIVSAYEDLERRKDYFSHYNNAGGDVFTRTTPLSLRNMIWFMIQRPTGDLPFELFKFLEPQSMMAGKSAYSLKRKLIMPNFIRRLMDAEVELFYNLFQPKCWNGHLLVAIDGTMLSLPNRPELLDHFGGIKDSAGNMIYPACQATIAHDVLNNVTLQAEIVKKNQAERVTFEDMYGTLLSRKLPAPILLLLDRGYFSYKLIYWMMRDGVPFVMKTRNEYPWVKSFLESGKKSLWTDITPSRDTSIFTLREWRDGQQRTLRLRLVRFDHPDGSADVLVTNMETDMASNTDVINLYRKRWSVETSYGVYKNDLAVELFSSYRVNGILQDFYATIICYNLVSAFMNCIPPDGPGRYHRRKKRGQTNKYAYAIDINATAGMLISSLSVIILGNHNSKALVLHIMESAWRCREPVIPSRSYPRIKRKRKVSGKHFKNTNYAQNV